jgi:predicted outer membrane repeat protein
VGVYVKWNFAKGRKMKLLLLRSSLLKLSILVVSLISFQLFSAEASASGVFSMGSQSGGPSAVYPQIPFYLDFGISQNQAKVKGGGLSAEQTLMVFQMSGTFAVGGMFFGGVTYDYRTMTQYSEANAIDGSQSGKREFFAPVLGARFSNFVAKLDYQVSGDYHLDKKSSGGSDRAYGAPKGYRATLLMDLYRGLSAGLSYETVSYSAGVDSSLGAIALSQTLDVTQIGLSLAYVY